MITRRSIRLWLIPVVVLILAITGCAQKNAPSHAQMMISDLETVARGEEIKAADQPMPMPSEPLLFKLPKDAPPAAMLSDAEKKEQHIKAESLEKAAKPKPVPLPLEPAPR